MDATVIDGGFIAAGIGTCAAASAGLNIDVCVFCDPVAELPAGGDAKTVWMV